MNEQAAIETQEIKNKYFYDNVLMLEQDIKYPQISKILSPYVQRKINRYNQKEATSLDYYTRRQLYPMAVKQYEYAKKEGFPFNNYVLMSVFEVKYNKYPLLSFYFERYEYTGGAHGITIPSSDTWDLTDARRLILKQLFKKGYNYKAVILAEIEKQAEQRKNSGEIDYFDDYKKLIVQNFDSENYFLSPDGLSIYYDLYTIGPYVIGIQTFTIPYEIFGGNLRYDL